MESSFVWCNNESLNSSHSRCTAEKPAEQLFIWPRAGCSSLGESAVYDPSAGQNPSGAKTCPGMNHLNSVRLPSPALHGFMFHRAFQHVQFVQNMLSKRIVWYPFFGHHLRSCLVRTMNPADQHPVMGCLSSKRLHPVPTCDVLSSNAIFACPYYGRTLCAMAPKKTI